MPSPRTSLAMLGLIIVTFMTCSCSMFTPVNTSDLPPILSQDELIRPYTRLAKIQITREVYGSDYSLTSSIREWGYSAVRQEAKKMGADAVIFPEVSGHTVTHMLIPTTEYHAAGIAIKFK